MGKRKSGEYGEYDAGYKSQRKVDFDAMKKRGLCVKCGSTWGRDHKCLPKNDPSFGKELIFKMIEVKSDSDANHQHLEEIEPILAALKMDDDHSNFIRIPLLTWGKRGSKSPDWSCKGCVFREGKRERTVA